MQNSNPKKRQLFISNAAALCSEPPRKRARLNADPDPIEKLIQDYLQRLGHSALRPNQKKIISDVIHSNDVFLNMATSTGSGKSLCFQISALVRNQLCRNKAKPAISIVICPTIGLMEDQVTKLKKRRISAVAWNSSLKKHHKTQITELIKNGTGDLDIIYTTPESLLSRKTGIKDMLKKHRTVTTFCIDEVHCVAMWGSSFRPSYFRLAESLKDFNYPTVIACTATVSPTMRQDIIKNLNLTAIKMHSFSSNRINIHLSTECLENEKAVFRRALELIHKLHAAHPNDTILVFCGMIKTANLCYEYVKSNDTNIVPGLYHSKMKKDENKALLKEFLAGTKNVIVATSGFGMGIDKPNVRGIIHLAMPANPEEWTQQFGRAGRDGKQSYAYLLTHHKDNFARLCVSQSSKQDIRLVGKFLFDNYERNEHKCIGRRGDLYKEFHGIPLETQLNGDSSNSEDEVVRWSRFGAAMDILQRYGIVHVGGGWVYLLKKHSSIEDANIDWKEIARTDEQSMHSYQQMNGIVTTDKCIRQRLLMYFGEQYQKPNDEQHLCCKNCNFLRKELKSNLSG